MGTNMVSSQVAYFSGLACLVAGQGPTLVLLHGGAGSSSHWSRNIDTLATAYRVFAFDMPGFGRSPDVPAGTEAETYIDWVAAAVAEVAASQTYRLTGFSFGAVIAAGIGARHCGRITSLSLAGPGGFGSPVGRRLDLRALPDGADDSAHRCVIRHNLLQIMIADPSHVDDVTIDIQAENIRNTRFDSRRISLQDRLLKDIERCDAPLQLIWGAGDHLAYPSIDARAALCRGVRPDTRVDIIPAAGHWVQYEQPAAFNEALLSFVPEASRLQRV
jgi:pimeloyl-ACP methyl ester carboxylesterase